MASGRHARTSGVTDRRLRAFLLPTSVVGTFRTSRDVGLESAFGGKAEVVFQGREDRF